jgi:phosphoenolpyruvate---glycerone phosphotransferase subunit DhaL
VADVLDVRALSGWVREFDRSVAEHEAELTGLDAAIGDADHGANMHRGLSAAVAVLDGTPPADPAALFKQVGMTLISKVGGASGPLYGTLFLRMAGAVGDGEVDAATFARAMRAGLDGVLARGKAEPGDKTMVDALGPACDALDAGVAAGESLAEALHRAAAAAGTGRDATVPMLARKGRASYLGERSIGHQDPGATTTALLIDAAVTTLGGGEG